MTLVPPHLIALIIINFHCKGKWQGWCDTNPRLLLPHLYLNWSVKAKPNGVRANENRLWKHFWHFSKVREGFISAPASYSKGLHHCHTTYSTVYLYVYINLLLKLILIMKACENVQSLHVWYYNCGQETFNVICSSMYACIHNVIVQRFGPYSIYYFHY